MLVAVAKLRGGYRVVAALAGGAGKISIDGLLGKAKWGAKGTLFALGAGVIGSFAAVELGRRSAPTDDSTSDQLASDDLASHDAADEEVAAVDSL